MVKLPVHYRARAVGGEQIERIDGRVRIRKVPGVRISGGQEHDGKNEDSSGADSTVYQ